MTKAAMLIALLAVFAFSSAQACDWMKNSTRVNYANKVEQTAQPVADKAPVVKLDDGKAVVTITEPTSGTN